mgnify:CR=1 FL=1
MIAIIDMRWTLLFILSVAHVCLCQLETVTVTSEQGELRGKVATTVRGLEYYSFQGIPYAKAPVGPLRFKVRDIFVSISDECCGLPTKMGMKDDVII